MVTLLTTTNSVILCSNTEMLLPTKMGYLQPKSCMDILSKTLCQPIDVPFHKNGNVRQGSAEQQAETTWQSSANTTTNMVTHLLKLALDPTWLSKPSHKAFLT